MYQDSYRPKYKFYWGGKMTAAVRALLIANGAVFLVQIFFAAALQDVLGARLEILFGLSAAYLRPWQFVTYMFLHSTGAQGGSALHIVFNMLWLWMLGKDVERNIGAKRFVILYLAAGAFAGLCHLAIAAVHEPRVPVIGASGAVFAVLVAYAVLFPDRLFLIFKAKYFVPALIAIEVLMSVAGDPNGVAHVAHLGGAAFGFLFFKGAPVWQKSLHKIRRRSARRHHLRELRVRAKVDALLDKISKQGLDALTDGEKAFLKKAGRRFKHESVTRTRR